MSVALPTPPPDSPFRIGYDEQGRVRLSWRPPYHWRSELVGWAFLTGFTTLLVIVIARIGQPGLAFCVALACAGMKVLHVLRQLRWERLTLGEAVLRYEGNDPSRLDRQAREVPRAEAGAIRLGWVTDPPGGRSRPSRRPRPCLTLGQGAERVEIGADLRGSDRDWLAEVVRAWARQAGAPAPGAEAGQHLPLAIEVESDKDGVFRLRWQPNSLGLMSARRTTVVRLSSWLLGWAIGGAGLLLPTTVFLWACWQAGGGNVWLWIPLVVLLVALWEWASAGRKAIREFLPLLRGPTEERLTLTRQALHYQPGRYFDVSRLIQLQEMFKEAMRWYPGRYFEGQAVRSGPPREVPLSELGAVRLERVDDRPRLMIEHGEDSFEVGPTLCEPDREWLAGVLRTWVAAGAEGVDSSTALKTP
jgi:hypothetical protein